MHLEIGENQHIKLQGPDPLSLKVVDIETMEK
jgi:hypothetical protein